jgi:hypothetical protein
MKNINEKTAPNQMRELIKRMRGEYVTETKGAKLKGELTMRDMLKITRRINENNDSKKDTVGENRKIPTDQNNEETKFTEIFNNMPNNETVSIVFFELYVFDNLVYWGGIIDGAIEFTYQVTPNENKSGVNFDYHEDYIEDNPKNDEIIKRIEEYYNKFSDYWRNEVLNGNRRI